MLFNSYTFVLIFLPAALAAYYASRYFWGRELSFIILALASLVYYGYWKPVYLLLLFFSIFFNYSAGQLICRFRGEKIAKAILVISISANLLLLGVFKYADFFIENISSITNYSIDSVNIILPLAISFFTFQQIAYLVDIYRSETEEYKFSHYVLFVTFFPQLIAGPIVHHKEMLPQFMRKTSELIDTKLVWLGMIQFSIGLFKKVLIADNIALYATPVFQAAEYPVAMSGVDAWIGALAYSLQLYFDFSAYSDMAMGIGLMFGIRLPVNFNSPYKAVSIVDFWRRWHITLSRFLRDYLYISLGGNRKGDISRYKNLLTTMLLGGLWHGASWNFVLWGGMHGIYLIINHGWTAMTSKFVSSEMRQCFVWIRTAHVITIFSVVLAWVLFRAETLDGAIRIYQALFQFGGGPDSVAYFDALIITDAFKAATLIGVFGLVAFVLPNTVEVVRWIENDCEDVESHKYALVRKVLMSKVTMCLLTSGFLAVSLSSMNKISEFLYFQF